MNNIKKIRQQIGLTVLQLAEKADLSPGYLSDLENGVKNNPSFKTLTKLSTALGVEITTLIGDKAS